MDARTQIDQKQQIKKWRIDLKSNVQLKRAFLSVAVRSRPDKWCW